MTRGRSGPIAYTDSFVVAVRCDDWNVVDLPTLIKMKLAARRFENIGDVSDRIWQNHLDEPFQERLHETVRSDYSECLEKKRRKNEHERRQDQTVEELHRKSASSKSPKRNP